MPVNAWKTRRISSARLAAFDVLTEVEEGGYASDLLRIRTADVETRDAGLAGQIVFGTLRFQLQLDHLISTYSGRAAAGLHRAVMIALRMALFQLRYLSRVPPHAAVHETVELVKIHRRAASGFANAVLRKVNRDAVPWPDRATELCCPAYLLQRWDEHFGTAQSDAVARAGLDSPDEYIRVPAGEDLPPGLQVEPTEVAGAFLVTGGQRREAVRLQDIGSQAIIPLLDLQAGQRFLDLCSAPGNKTRQALESNPGLAIACDVSFARLSTVGPLCPRVVLDGTRALPFPAGSFDRIFVDAPCSGTGTIRRNPEIKWRVRTHDFGAFREKQIGLVEQAAKALKPDGKLLYATCSLEREENEDVVSAICERTSLRLEKSVWRIPGRDPGDGFYAAVLTAGQDGKPC